MTSSLPLLIDATSVGGSVFDAVSSFGPLQPMLDDLAIDELSLSGQPETA